MINVNTNTNTRGVTAAKWTNNLITGWTNSSTYLYETFISVSENITSAINTTALASAYTNSLSNTIGDIYVMECDLTINSGVAPKALFMLNGDALSGAASNNAILTSGHNRVEFTTIASYSNIEFVLRTTASGDAQNYSVSNFSLKKKL